MSEEKKKAHGAKIQEYRKYKKHPNAIEVLQVSKDGFLLYVHDSISSASKSVNVCSDSIYEDCTSKTHHSKGYLWYFNR